MPGARAHAPSRAVVGASANRILSSESDAIGEAAMATHEGARALRTQRRLVAVPSNFHLSLFNNPYLHIRIFEFYPARLYVTSHCETRCWGSIRGLSLRSRCHPGRSTDSIHFLRGQQSPLSFQKPV